MVGCAHCAVIVIARGTVCGAESPLDKYNVPMSVEEDRSVGSSSEPPEVQCLDFRCTHQHQRTHVFDEPLSWPANLRCVDPRRVVL